MRLADCFRPIPCWSQQEFADYTRQHGAEEYRILDVRQAAEFAQGHLPGATLMPLGELHEALPDLDPSLTYILCSDGDPRAVCAASILLGADVNEVHPLNAPLATAPALAHGEVTLPGRFLPLATPAEQAVLAWHLEAATCRFYQAAAAASTTAAPLFTDLAKAEEGHKMLLRQLYEALAGKTASNTFPEDILPSPPPGKELLEGGMPLTEALTLLAQGSDTDHLILALGIEANALDRYLHLRRELNDENACRLFEVLSDEELRHLKQLASTLDTAIPPLLSA